MKRGGAWARRRLIRCLILFAVLGAGSDCWVLPARADGLSAPELPAGSHVPTIRRLPDGRIVPADPEDSPAQSPGAATPVVRPVAAAAPSAPAPVKETQKPVRTALPAPGPVIVPVAATAHQAKAVNCPSDAITCVRVTGGGQAMDWRPVTFGQPFRRGDVPAHTELAANDEKGTVLPLQADAKVTHPDGSLRFAVLSTVLPKLAANESRIIAIRRGGAAPSNRLLPSPDDTSKFDLKVDLSVFSRQTTVVKFGDRRGTTPGIPFKAGETIGLKVGDEKFSLTVTPQMSGGTLNPYMYIAQAFVPVINGQSKRFRARWNDANDGYEKLWITTADRSGAFQVSADYSGQAEISVNPYTAVEQPEHWVASLAAATGRKPWLAGQVATESDFVVPFVSAVSGKAHPQLMARIRLRHYPQANAFRADVVLENDWAFDPGPRNYTYDVTIRRNDQVVYSHNDVTQFHHARWHKVIWSDGLEEPSIDRDGAYLLASGAVPHYDPHLSIAESVVARDFQALANADTGPFGPALLTPYMPTTGGRADIGPLPRWTAIYLLTMDPRERAVMFANADAGAGIPLHYRDRQTGLPISLDDHPTIAMGPGRASPQDAFPPVVMGDNPWTPQVAHHPSLSYVPYLLSGDLFYLEELAFWADWVMATADPGYRNGAQGLITLNEVRGQAWALRTLAEAAVAYPDDDPMKGYFSRKLGGNLAWYKTRYLNNSDPDRSPVIGVVPKPDDPGIMAPWQQDFLFIALGQLADLGFSDAEDMVRWLARFTVGRWTSDSAGFCHQLAPAYYIKIRDAGMRYARTLKEVSALNWPDVQTCPASFPFGDPNSGGGYVANAHAALAVGVDHQIPGALEAFTRLRAETPMMVRAFSDDPTFDLVPRK